MYTLEIQCRGEQVTIRLDPYNATPRVTAQRMNGELSAARGSQVSIVQGKTVRAMLSQLGQGEEFVSILPANVVTSIRDCTGCDGASAHAGCRLRVLPGARRRLFRFVSE